MILHLTNDYSGSKVYMNLIKSIDNLGVDQYIYVPLRSNNLIDRNKIDFDSNKSYINYSPILSTYTRLNYKAKIKRILLDIESKVSIKEINVIHAHTWFSDGGVAYELHKKTGIPYIVTIRNTDLNLFFKYMIHLRVYGMEIIKAASKLIFISAVYKERFMNIKYIQSKYRTVLNNKCELIPNGIDEFWIDNSFKKDRVLNEKVKLLYVGNFSKNKNVLRLIQAVKLLNKSNDRFQLTIVGKNGRQEKAILRMIKGKKSFNYLGEIQSKKILLNLFRESNIFAMPSHSETFGLVYVEALSQDIPIIYTMNEGIDGYYNHLQIGEGVKSKNVLSISQGIRTICDNYKLYTFDNQIILQNHKWNEIAKIYRDIYLDITL